MDFDEQTIIASPTGAALNLLSTLPAGRPRGIVQINHGLAEHAARYGRFARFLAERNLAAYAHDHRGHGHTRAPDAPPGVFASGGGGAGKVLGDVAAVHDEIARRHPGIPVVLFGHSMGGLIGLNFALRHSGRLAGAAIWNANFSAGLLGRVAQALLAWERFRLGSDMPSRLLPMLTFQAWARKVPRARTAFDWLSHDPDEVDRYVADPLCGWDASVSMWRDVFELIFSGAHDGSFPAMRRDLPVSLLGGDEDPATEGGKAVEVLAGRMRRMGFSNVVSRIRLKARHETLNETDRDAVMDDFAGWALASVAERSGKT